MANNKAHYLLQQATNGNLVKIRLQKTNVGKGLVLANFFAGVIALEFHVKKFQLKQKADLALVFLFAEQNALVQYGTVFFGFGQNDEFGKLHNGCI